MRNVALPLLLILFGAMWLAHVLGLIPDLRAIGGMALVVAGIAVLAIEGINKRSVVTGPVLMFCGAAWLGLQHGYLTRDLVAPLFLIVVGACLFVARLPGVPSSSRRSRREEVREDGAPQ